jgi:hypothetical protein
MLRFAGNNPYEVCYQSERHAHRVSKSCRDGKQNTEPELTQIEESIRHGEVLTAAQQPGPFFSIQTNLLVS